MKNNQPVSQREYDFPAGDTLLSTTDTAGRITYANAAFIQVSGFDMEEMQHKAHNIVRHPDMPVEAYADMWRSLKAGREPDLLSPLSVTTDINLHAPALLPEDYCGDVHLRLSFYKKLATAKTGDQIDALTEEIVDRFGKLPVQAQTLIDVHRLRVIAKPYGVVKVDAAPGVIHITFRANPPVEPMRIIELVQKNRHIKLAGNEKLRIERALAQPRERAQMVRDVLRSLGQPLNLAETVS